MPKKLCAFRLSQKSLANIEQLQALTGKPKVVIVETGLGLYLDVELSKKSRLYNNFVNSYTQEKQNEGV